jgi:hypothetical protein
MKLEITVGDWIHRTDLELNPLESCLLRLSDGKKCCLGFYLLACGVAPKDLINIATPYGVNAIPLEADWLVANGNITEKVNSSDARALMRENDGMESDDVPLENKRSLKLTDRERIKEIFAKHDVQVEFVE